MDPNPISCPSCGSSVPNRTFCRDCGARLAKKTCRICGHEVDGHSTFCAECGEALRADGAGAASPPRAPMTPDAGRTLPPPFISRGASSGWLRRGVPAPTTESSAAPLASSEQGMTYAPPQAQTNAPPTYAIPESLYAAPPPVISPTYEDSAPLAPERPGRLKAAAKGIGALVALLAAILFLSSAVTYFDDHLPDKTGLITALFGLTLGALWLGGGIWLVRRASWAWAAAWWLAWPIALPVYAYKAAHGEDRQEKASFPTNWVTGGITVVASALFVGGAAFSSNPITPQGAEAESRGGQEVAAVVPEATSTLSIPTDEAVEPTLKPTKTAKATRTPQPTGTATAKPNRTPKPTKTATSEPTRKPRPTRTPRPKPTRTPRSKAAASYDSRHAADELLHGSILRDEDADYGNGYTVETEIPGPHVDASVMQSADWGNIFYWVFDSDQAALNFVEERQSGASGP